MTKLTRPGAGVSDRVTTTQCASEIPNEGKTVFAAMGAFRQCGLRRQCSAHTLLLRYDADCSAPDVFLPSQKKEKGSSGGQEGAGPAIVISLCSTPTSSKEKEDPHVIKIILFL